jgi:hypothetical protein
MITTVIGMIERWWREKPRLDVVRSVVQLRDAMHECEEAYGSFVASKKAADRQRSKMLWNDAFIRLTDAASGLSAVFEVFSPKTVEAIGIYMAVEQDHLEKEFIDAKRELEDEFGIHLSQVKLSPEFTEAMDALDEFIKANFKVEEVHAARTSRFR